MSQTVIGVIGGSGVYGLEGLEIIKEHNVHTPYGAPSSSIVEANLNGAPFFFIARHGKGHVLLPTEVNYCANIYALKLLGAKYVLSVSAVGSLQNECPPGSFVFPNQFIDWTKGYRRRTFFGEGLVGHVSNAHPVNKDLKKRLYDISKDLGIKSRHGGTYICIEGPQFSSLAESEFYRSILGATIIGMTNVPEAFLAKEAGMAYATVAMVTDYDCWNDEHCTVEEILKVIRLNFSQVNELLTRVIPSLHHDPISFERENQNIVMTGQHLLTETHKQVLEVLLR